MSAHEEIEGMLRELRKFREELPKMAEALAKQQVSGKAANGSVRAHADVSGSVSRVEVESYFLRRSQPSQVDAALLEALRDAEAAASRAVNEQQEKLRFMGMPVGEVMSGKRSLADILPSATSSQRNTLKSAQEDQ